MLKKAVCRADISFELEVLGPVLVKAGDVSLEGTDMSFVRTGKDQQPYFPGTSLKGVFRSFVERAARTLKRDEGAVCLPYDQGRGNTQSCGKRFDEMDKPDVYRSECAACRMFGSLQFRGRVSVDDAYSTGGRPKTEYRNGVAIDRKTGGSAATALFDYEVLVDGTFGSKVHLINFEMWQLGATALFLRELSEERIRLGMGNSRGLGHVKGTVNSIELRYPRVTEINTLVGLGDLADAAERSSYGLIAGSAGIPITSGFVNDGIWKLAYFDADGSADLLRAAEEEFISYMEQYSWPGGSA